jgi:YVTN family beta-propeller protein
LDTVTGKESGKPLPVGDRPGRLALSQDGKRIFVVTTSRDLRTNTLVALDLPAGGNVIGRVSLEQLPVDLAVSPDGRRVYVADLLRGVSVIDTRTIARVGVPIPIEGGPWDIEVSSDSSRVFVAMIEGGISVLPASHPTDVTELRLDSD